jgi:hypothetical protein
MMTNLHSKSVGICLVMCLCGLIACTKTNPETYTLYRNGLDLKNPDRVDETLRFYIASFNLPNEIKYNQANCQLTADALNKEQAHYQNSIYSKIRINYWCEKGEFKK